MTEKIVAAALRKKNGVWNLIDDSGHTPLGVSSVEEVGNVLKVNFSFTADKVRSVIVAPDESYAAEGYTCGASVGLDSAKIWIYKSAEPVGGYCFFHNGSWNTLTGNLDEIEVVSGNVIKVHHPDAYPSDSIFLSLVGRGNGKYLYRSEGAGADYTNVGIYHLNGAPVASFQSDMKFFLTRITQGRRVSPSEMPEGWTNLWLYGQLKA